MRVIFRADASRTLGAGHVMRCLTLADELAGRGARCHFLCQETDGHLGALILARGHGLEWIPPLAGWRADAAASQSVLDRMGVGRVDWLVVDHYQLDREWEQAMAPRAARLLVLDDMANRPHHCQLLVDQNLQPPGRYAPWVAPECTCLLGPDYALLRPGFRRHRPVAPRRPERVTRLLVFFGGGDESNETGKVLEALSGLPVAVDVVIGGAHAHRDALAARCAGLPGCQVHFQVDDMAALMARADLALGATGVSTWERACLGLPAVVVSVADNQHPIARAGQDAGLHTWLGPAWEVDTAAWRAALVRVLDDPQHLAAQSAAGLTRVDGLGVARVADRMAP